MILTNQYYSILLGQWIDNSNDGLNCPVTVKNIPEEFGDVFGYVWVDFNDDGLRTSIEDGSEPHVTGYDVTIRNATQYRDSSGNVVHEAGEMEYSGVMSGTDTGIIDGRRIFL